MSNLLAVAALTIASSLSPAAIAEQAESVKEDAGTSERAEAQGERGEAKGEHGEAQGEPEKKDGEEKGSEEAEGAEPKLIVNVDTLIGFGNLPDEGASAVTTSFMLGGWYAIAPEFSLGVRWPFTVGSISDATGSYAAVASGNVEMAGEYGLTVAPGTKVMFELGAALPTASGDEFQTGSANAIRRAMLNEAAADARGGLDNALFAAHRFGLIPLLGLEYERGHIEAAVWTKMEVLIKAGGVTPADPIEQHGVAAESVSRASFYYWFLDDQLALGARAWLTAAIVEEAEDPTVAAPSKFQLVLEPGVKAKLGPFQPAIGYIAPVGGALGDRNVGGFHLIFGMAY